MIKPVIFIWESLPPPTPPPPQDICMIKYLAPFLFSSRVTGNRLGWVRYCPHQI